MGVSFRLQIWVPNVVKMWLRHVVAKWSKRGPQKCFQPCGYATWPKRGRDMNAKVFFALFFAFRERSPFGDSISTTLVFAHPAKRNSGTTLLSHVVTSLLPLFQFCCTSPCSPDFALKLHDVDQENLQ